MLIKINNLSKSFKIFKRKAGLKGALQSFLKRNYYMFDALKDINLTIQEGEILGILGENGAGKTTLIKLIIGLLHPSNGNILVNQYIPWERNHNYLMIKNLLVGIQLELLLIQLEHIQVLKEKKGVKVRQLQEILL